MIEQSALVVTVEGELAEVETRRQTACGPRHLHCFGQIHIIPAAGRERAPFNTIRTSAHRPGHGIQDIAREVSAQYR